MARLIKKAKIEWCSLRKTKRHFDYFSYDINSTIILTKTKIKFFFVEK